MNPRLINDQELMRPDRHCFLSPHYDDIALSCGGTARKIADGGRSAEIDLIFGDHPDSAQPMTEFAERLHRQWGLDAAQVIASRRSEESAASAILGTTARFLPFRDAIYRGRRYLGDDQLFSSPADDEESMAGEIIVNLELPDGTRVYAPLAVGFHVDHQHAFRTGVALAEQGVDVWFYEDLPYGLVPERRERRYAWIGDSLRPALLVDVSTQWEMKIDAIFAYPTQLTTVFEEYVGVESERSIVSEVMATYARMVGEGRLCERFWTLNQ